VPTTIDTEAGLLLDHELGLVSQYEIVDPVISHVSLLKTLALIPAIKRETNSDGAMEARAGDHHRMEIITEVLSNGYQWGGINTCKTGRKPVLSYNKLALLAKRVKLQFVPSDHRLSLECPQLVRETGKLSSKYLASL